MTIDGRAKLYGVIGNPITHSLSPLIHGSLIGRFGLNAAYVPLGVEPDKFDTALTGLVALGIAGANVTLPYKLDIIRHLASIDDEARRIGAVNTIARQDNGGYRGYNSDYLGFARSLGEKADAKGKDVLLIGAGGASRGVMAGLISLGVRAVAIVNIVDSMSRDLAKQFEGVLASIRVIDHELIGDLSAFPIVVNATSIGVAKGSDDTSTGIFVDTIFASLSPSAFFYDINYAFDHPTYFETRAKGRGMPFSQGLDMLLYQAFESFLIWHPVLKDTFDFAEERAAVMGLLYAK